MNQAAMLAKAALTYGDRPAVSLGTKVLLDYRTLADRVARLATSMRSTLGLAPGDRVALVMKNCAADLEVLFATWHAGLAAVPINAKLHQKEHAFILEQSGTAACFATGDLADSIREEAASIDSLHHVICADDPAYERLLVAEPMAMATLAPDDLAWLFYTSGTTGRPKGAMLSHRNLEAASLNYFADVDMVLPTDSLIHCAPMSHGSGLYALPFVGRGANNVIPESGGFGVPETLDLIAHWPDCCFFFAPTMITRLVYSEQIATADTSNLKTIVYGGGPMYLADAKAAIAAFGPKLVQIYGQGESPMTITGLQKHMFLEADHPRFAARLASVGVARTNVEVRVVDTAGDDLAVGEIGEIVVRGDPVMVGYWDNPEATANALRDGWLWTGDVGCFDADGFLTLKDRSKDMIISGGTNIYPREIEEVLLGHPGVFECAVVGRPHADWGEEVIAFVVAQPGAALDADALDKLCLDNIARFKRPKEYRFVAAIGKNNYGKILKTELREILAAESPGAG